MRQEAKSFNRNLLMANRPLVELLPAFVFTCDKCGSDTFVRTAVVEDPEIKGQAEEVFREIIANTDGEDAAMEWDGVVSTAPTEVLCSHCKTVYDVSVGGYDLETLGMFYDELYEDDGDEFEDEEEFFDEDEEWEDFDDEDDDEEFDDEDVEDF